MQANDFKRFEALMLGMGEMYGKEVSGVLLDAYWVALRDWEVKDFEAACAHLMAHSTFMPRPADFTALRKAGRTTSVEAWEMALTHVRTGAYRNQPTLDPVIDSAVRSTVGGYRQLAMSDEDDLHWLEKRFSQAYDTTTDVQETREAVPQITLHAADITPRLAADLKRLTARVTA